jgi:RND family efflux transporter MFP subunit
MDRADPAPELESLGAERSAHESVVVAESGIAGADEQAKSTFRVVGLALLALLLGGIAFGAWRHYQQNRQALLISERHRNFAPSVRVKTVTKSDGVVPITLPATIEAFESANIYARASGYIARRYVDIGSRVKQGEKLAEISAPELDDQIAQAEAVLSQAEAAVRQTDANRELARVTNSRTSVLAAKGWATRQQGDVDRLTYVAQQHAAQAGAANVQTQRAQLNVLRQRRSYLQVIAPFDGVVTQRNVDVGSLVQADATTGTFMFTTMRGNVVRIQTYVPQDQAFAIAPGVDALVKVSEMPGRVFAGKVTRIADALKPGTRTLLAEVDVKNPDGALVPGAYCTVELQIPRKTPSLIVPADAIIFNQSGILVAVVQNDVVRLQKINIARDLGTEVELRDGVEDGDEVIISPPVDLRDGQSVQVRVGPAGAPPRE